jgi:hypothetical protein
MIPHDRDAWLTYAREAGLVRTAPALPDAPRVNKYGARRAWCGGRWFASTKEATRYLELTHLVTAGAIDALECQPVFPLHILELWRPGAVVVTTVGRYTADFRYRDLATGEIVVEDVKSEATKTTDYKLRVRLAECIHGMTVTEV